MLPHTGVTDNQCYETGSDWLLSCGAAGPTTLNPQQDGHRLPVLTMSYSAVAGYPVTSCVRDNVTGLVWEGKEASGDRAESNTFTNYDDSARPQLWTGSGYRAPTPAEIAAPSNSVGYRSVVNDMSLCGFNDWRMPTWQELQTLADHSCYGPSINLTWFAGTSASRYCSASIGQANQLAWYLGFYSGGAEPALRFQSQRVRLVRGTAWCGARYTFATAAFGGDAANNVVQDARTGLQWRRCSQGQVWTGSHCSGSASPVTHEVALSQAGTASGWRLPNVKEPGSIVTRGRVSQL